MAHYFSSAGSDLASPQVLSVEEGANVSVACNVSDTTELIVFWMSNGTTGEFYENGTVLQLPNINRNESGLYTCFSYDLTYESQDNATEEQEVFLDVLCKFVSSIVISYVQVKQNPYHYLVEFGSE